MTLATLTMRLNCGPSRKMSVTRNPGTDNTPAIHIANRLLTQYGFNIADKIAVEYSNGHISITKIKDK